MNSVNFVKIAMFYSTNFFTNQQIHDIISIDWIEKMDFMDSTELIVKLIKERFKSIRQFAFAAGIPYSTVKSGLRAGINGMAVETVIKMCATLGIQMDTLAAFGQVPGHLPGQVQESSEKVNHISTDEYYLIEKYRTLSDSSKQDLLRYLEYRQYKEKAEAKKESHL